MRSLDDVGRFIARQPAMVAALDAVARCASPDAWIGAGFIRDAVWDALLRRAWSPGEGDVDVLYFDPVDLSREAERAFEARLSAADPTRPWSVKNQARMHLRNGDAPYRDMADALAHWLETCTAIAARLEAGRVLLLAPYGVSDLLALQVAPTPAGRRKPWEFRERVEAKGWLGRWPGLRITV